jgi:hypothetical protein
MPAIADIPPSQTATPISYFYADARYAQGDEGKKVFDKAKDVYRHWNERAEVLLMSRNATDEFSYEPAPPNRVFHVKTRYVYLGKGLPRPFDLDDE